MVDCVCSPVCRGWTQCLFLYNCIYPNAIGKGVQGGTVPCILELLVSGVSVCVQVPSVPETFRARQP